MNADNYSIRGTSHHFCQDFSISDESVPIIVVSDGCSGVEKYAYPELGAQLLTHSALSILRSEYNPLVLTNWELLGNAIREKAMIACKVLDAPMESLNATLMIAFKLYEKIIIHVWGDGTVIVIDKTGKISCQTIDFVMNSPFYLFNKDDNGRFAHRHWMNDKNYNPEQGKKIEKFEVVDKDGIAQITDSEKTREPFDTKFTLEIPEDEFKSITLASDGIGTLHNRKTNQLISIEHAINNCVNYKNFKGDFVKRRIKRYIEESAKEGFFNYDDLSIASIHA